MQHIFARITNNNSTITPGVLNLVEAVSTGRLDLVADWTRALTGGQRGQLVGSAAWLGHAAEMLDEWADVSELGRTGLVQQPKEFADALLFAVGEAAPMPALRFAAETTQLVITEHDHLALPDDWQVDERSLRHNGIAVSELELRGDWLTDANGNVAPRPLAQLLCGPLVGIAQFDARSQLHRLAQMALEAHAQNEQLLLWSSPGTILVT